MRVLGGGFVSLIGSQIRSYGGGAKAMNMAFIGIVLDGLGCLILVFTPPHELPGVALRVDLPAGAA